MERYRKNLGLWFTQEHQNQLSKLCIGVIGCGGQGGYLCEFLARLGVKQIICFDGDSFETSNLNRQRFSNLNTIGKSKVEVTKNALIEINPEIQYDFYNEFVTPNNYSLLENCNIIFKAAEWTSEVSTLILDLNIPIIDVANCHFGSEISVITKSNCSKEDLDTTLPQSQIAQPAWLCALSASLGMLEMWHFLFDLDYDILNQPKRFFIK